MVSCAFATIQHICTVIGALGVCIVQSYSAFGPHHDQNLLGREAPMLARVRWRHYVTVKW
ncbi:hypothetical protein BAUCODRAFT_28797 [Baudoinia panamericana UAMH 10762]|uniref:Uncharacterized protein n=1 Tax=Baudoinia panamericana (strain UAMH 10762) TaxID=717646 RepID=M2N8G8_BAUPA|nr:uncharacterized protein BAUCODRAFT_28797 [Baudoinia panamericana UAMH 10762]EMD00439.1 hypothetical protein BAUCODRAFT_28797 [Baudoinia panamericana UAMH 10762]